MSTTPAGWYADPEASFELRYWDGAAWTEHVSTNGIQSASPPRGRGEVSQLSVDHQRTQPADGKPNRRKVILIAAAASVAVVLGLLLVEHDNEKTALAEYQALAQKESENREAILTQYQKRDSELGKIVETQDDIDATLATMKKSDCYTANPCDGSEKFNKNLDQLEELFNQIQTLGRANQAAVNKVNKIAEPDGLWLLSLLGENDSDKTQNVLKDYLPRIEDAKTVINKNISAIDTWNSDCVDDTLISCDADPLPLEKES